MDFTNHFSYQFGRVKRFESIPKQMVTENIISLEIEWFVTFDDSAQITHSPIYVESLILQEYFEINGRLPRWNQKF